MDSPGEMVERFIASVLKTEDPKGSGGSNPPLSSIKQNLFPPPERDFILSELDKVFFKNEITFKKAYSRQYKQFLKYRSQQPAEYRRAI